MFKFLEMFNKRERELMESIWRGWNWNGGYELYGWMVRENLIDL